MKQWFHGFASHVHNCIFKTQLPRQVPAIGPTMLMVSRAFSTGVHSHIKAGELDHQSKLSPQQLTMCSSSMAAFSWGVNIGNCRWKSSFFRTRPPFAIHLLLCPFNRITTPERGGVASTDGSTSQQNHTSIIRRTVHQSLWRYVPGRTATERKLELGEITE